MAKNTACTNYFLSWEAIHGYCRVNNLQKVLEVFKYNMGQIY